MASQQTINVYVRSNGLGTAGFVVSLISFFCCGISAPLGLLMSLVALLWAPRGMAAAGVILGALGSWWLFAVGLGILATMAGAMNEAKKGGASPPPSVAPRIDKPPMIELQDQPPATPPKAQESIRPRREETKAATAEPETTPAEPAVTTPPAKPLRLWTSATGTFQTEAAFVSRTDDKVKLRKADGTELTVPLERLSDEDRQWLKDYERRR